MKSYCLHNPPAHAEEIKGLQKALKEAKLYRGPIDGIFGASTGDAAYRAKYRLGYPKRAVNHCGGQQLLDYLRGVRKLPPSFLARRHIRGYGLTRGQRQRAAIVKYALWGASNASQIHYLQARPMDKLNQVESLPWWTDCSEFVTTIYKWAGAPDPNGWNYNGYGNTDTMWNSGKFIPLWDAQPADVVIWRNYGWGTHHTAVIVDVSDKPDPMIVSHGSEGGPYHFHLSAENAAQRGRQYAIKRYISD